MSTKAMNDLRDILCEEIDKIAKKQELSAGDLETVHKLTDTVKNIDKICLMDETGEYSQSGDWEMNGRGTYDRGNSYAGRKRDSMGRYSRNMHYSRDSAKERMIDRLTDIMDDDETEEERETIMRCVNKLKNA